MDDRGPPTVEDSPGNVATFELCQAACFSHAHAGEDECAAVTFNSLIKCSLIITGADLLSDGSGGYQCYKRNPAYLAPPDIVYTELPGVCVIEATGLEPAGGLKNVRAGLMTDAQCRQICDDEVCWAYQLNKEN